MYAKDASIPNLKAIQMMGSVSKNNVPVTKLSILIFPVA